MKEQPQSSFRPSPIQMSKHLVQVMSGMNSELDRDLSVILIWHWHLYRSASIST
jgi:hypothetical protein